MSFNAFFICFLINQVANTQLAASVSGFTWLILDGIHTKKTSLLQLFNGIVAGLAGITPAAGFVTPQWALLMSVILGVASFYGYALQNVENTRTETITLICIHTDFLNP